MKPQYPIKSSLFTCFVNKFQPVKLLEQKGACYIPCIEVHQYFIDLEFTNYVLVWYLIIDLISDLYVGFSWLEVQTQW